MLHALTVRGFKSLINTDRVEFAPLTVLFGPNAAGKSNILDAVQVLSRLASERTVADALTTPVRGLPLETFSFPPSGLPGLLKSDSASFAIEADLKNEDAAFRYRAQVSVRPASGALSVTDELLATLSRTGDLRGAPAIELADGQIRVRSRSRPGRPRQERVGQNYTQLSDRRLSGTEYRVVERARQEMSSWRTYYLDPRVAMREPQVPQEVTDIGTLGEHIASYLYRLRDEKPKGFAAVRRTLRTLVPSIEDLSVELDTKMGVLDVDIHQDGTPFSSRVVSEGTLRVLAIACVATNPWESALVAFEEPENGVHPRRIELVARILVSLATQPNRQVIVTTHSPLFCGSVIRLSKDHPTEIRLYQVSREGNATSIRLFESAGPLFEDEAIMQGLTSPTEDGVFEGLARRGMLDA